MANLSHESRVIQYGQNQETFTSHAFLGDKSEELKQENQAQLSAFVDGICQTEAQFTEDATKALLYDDTQESNYNGNVSCSAKKQFICIELLKFLKEFCPSSTHTDFHTNFLFHCNAVFSNLSNEIGESYVSLLLAKLLKVTGSTFSCIEQMLPDAIPTLLSSLDDIAKYRLIEAIELLRQDFATIAGNSTSSSEIFYTHESSTTSGSLYSSAPLASSVNLTAYLPRESCLDSLFYSQQLPSQKSEILESEDQHACSCVQYDNAEEDVSISKTSCTSDEKHTAMSPWNGIEERNVTTQLQECSKDTLSNEVFFNSPSFSHIPAEIVAPTVSESAPCLNSKACTTQHKDPLRYSLPSYISEQGKYFQTSAQHENEVKKHQMCDAHFNTHGRSTRLRRRSSSSSSSIFSSSKSQKLLDGSRWTEWMSSCGGSTSNLNAGSTSSNSDSGSDLSDGEDSLGQLGLSRDSSNSEISEGTFFSKKRMKQSFPSIDAAAASLKPCKANKLSFRTPHVDSISLLANMASDGVFFVDSGGTGYWECRWVEHGICYSKRFSIDQYSDEIARNLATQFFQEKAPQCRKNLSVSDEAAYESRTRPASCQDVKTELNSSPGWSFVDLDSSSHAGGGEAWRCVSSASSAFHAEEPSYDQVQKFWEISESEKRMGSRMKGKVQASSMLPFAKKNTSRFRMTEAVCEPTTSINKDIFPAKQTHSKKFSVGSGLRMRRGKGRGASRTSLSHRSEFVSKLLHKQPVEMTEIGANASLCPAKPKKSIQSIRKNLKLSLPKYARLEAEGKTLCFSRNFQLLPNLPAASTISELGNGQRLRSCVFMDSTVYSLSHFGTGRWVACWEINGRCFQRSFAISKYGNDEAKHRAEAIRDQKIAFTFSNTQQQTHLLSAVLTDQTSPQKKDFRGNKFWSQMDYPRTRGRPKKSGHLMFNMSAQYCEMLQNYYPSADVIYPLSRDELQQENGEKIGSFHYAVSGRLSTSRPSELSMQSVSPVSTVSALKKKSGGIWQDLPLKSSKKGVYSTENGNEARQKRGQMKRSVTAETIAPIDNTYTDLLPRDAVFDHESNQWYVDLPLGKAAKTERKFFSVSSVGFDAARKLALSALDEAERCLLERYYEGNSHGVAYERSRHCWRVTFWIPSKQIRRNKYFNVSKYGWERAKNLAILYRQKVVELVGEEPLDWDGGRRLFKKKEDPYLHRILEKDHSHAMKHKQCAGLVTDVTGLKSEGKGGDQSFVEDDGKKVINFVKEEVSPTLSITSMQTKESDVDDGFYPYTFNSPPQLATIGLEIQSSSLNPSRENNRKKCVGLKKKLTDPDQDSNSFLSAAEEKMLLSMAKAACATAKKPPRIWKRTSDPDHPMSDVKGVHYSRREKAWVCRWSDVKEDKVIVRSFQIKNYGFDEAKRKAEELRLEKEHAGLAKTRGPSDLIVPGVRFCQGKTGGQGTWQVFWTRRGKTFTKSFKIETYGADQAKLAALCHKQKVENRLASMISAQGFENTSNLTQTNDFSSVHHPREITSSSIEWNDDEYVAPTIEQNSVTVASASSCPQLQPNLRASFMETPNTWLLGYQNVAHNSDKKKVVTEKASSTDEIFDSQAISTLPDNISQRRKRIDSETKKCRTSLTGAVDMDIHEELSSISLSNLSSSSDSNLTQLSFLENPDNSSNASSSLADATRK